MFIFLILIFHQAVALTIPATLCFNDNNCLIHGPDYRCKPMAYPNGHWSGICYNIRPSNSTKETLLRQMARFRECCTNEDCGADLDLGCNVDLGCPIYPIAPGGQDLWRPWERDSK